MVTRCVGRSPEGENLLNRIASLIAQIDDAVSASDETGSVTGELRLNAPLPAASYPWAEIVPTFPYRYPAIKLDLRPRRERAPSRTRACIRG